MANRIVHFVRRHPFVSWSIGWMIVLFVPWSILWLRIVGECPECVPNGCYMLGAEPKEELTGYPCFSYVDHTHPIQIDFENNITPLFSYREKNGTKVYREPAKGSYEGTWYYKNGTFIFEERKLGVSYMALCLGLAQKTNRTKIEYIDDSTLKITTRQGECGLLFFLIPWFDSFTYSCNLTRLPNSNLQGPENSLLLTSFPCAILSEDRGQSHYDNADERMALPIFDDQLRTDTSWPE